MLLHIYASFTVLSAVTTLATRKLRMKKVTIRGAVFLGAAWLAGCGQAAAGCGVADAYAPGTGTRVEPNAHAGISAASQSLPPGTRVIVRNQQKGRSIVVRIADRSPSLLGRIIDLSTEAMNALGMNTPSPVCVEVVSYGSASRGFGRITVRNPMAEVKHAAVPKPKHATLVALSAHARSHAKSARVHDAKAKRHAQVHRSNERVKKSNRRHLTARS